ncbi:MAG: hypothetical protein AAF431_00240 [Pseudomonadota bacterium]
MKSNPLITIPLWGLVIFGFISVGKVSIDNYNGLACPSLLMVPVCYVVTAAYGLMLAALIINHNGCKHHFFCVGWGTAFVIAMFASIAEIFGGGGVCPTTSGGLRAGSSIGIPLCYISLVILVAILVLFIKGPYQAACDAQD